MSASRFHGDAKLPVKRSVLLGGRCVPKRRTAFAHGMFVWLPVVFMLLVIARESTVTFGGSNTSRWLRPFYEHLFGTLDDARWEVIHHSIRKTGHFVGYGLLGLAWLRAFLLTWLWSFRQQTAGVWRRWSLQMALCCTALVASMDEVHQSYLADRTGQVSDIVLDTTGAAVFCGILLLAWTTLKYRDSAFQYQ